MAPRGSSSTFGEMLDLCRLVTGSTARLTWIDSGVLSQQGVRQWTEFPLWVTADVTWQVDDSRAASLGLECRSMHDTVADTWSWLTSGNRPIVHDRAAQGGVRAAKEAALLARWRSNAPKRHTTSGSVVVDLDLHGHPRDRGRVVRGVVRPVHYRYWGGSGHGHGGYRGHR